MNEDMEVTVTVTPEDMEFRARAKAAGLPNVLISMYGSALRRLVADEREAGGGPAVTQEREGGQGDEEVAERAASKDENFSHPERRRRAALRSG